MDGEQQRAAGRQEAHAHLARPRLGVLHHVGEGLVRPVGMAGDGERRAADQHHVEQVRILVGKVGREGRTQDVAVERHHPGLAVGQRLGHVRRADRPGRARLAVDHRRPAGVVAHLGGQQARHRIGRAAGREGHDDADRALGPVTRLGAGDCGCGQRRHQQRTAKHFRHGDLPSAFIVLFSLCSPLEMCHGAGTGMLSSALVSITFCVLCT